MDRGRIVGLMVISGDGLCYLPFGENFQNISFGVKMGLRYRGLVECCGFSPTVVSQGCGNGILHPVPTKKVPRGVAAALSWGGGVLAGHCHCGANGLRIMVLFWGLDKPQRAIIILDAGLVVLILGSPGRQARGSNNAKQNMRKKPRCCFGRRERNDF